MNVGVGKVKIAIDRGGTFTDVWAGLPGRSDIVLKLLSVDPSNYDDAPTEGVRRVLSLYYGKEIPRSQPLPKTDLEFIRMGTTVATNALLERKGTRHAFLVTKGFRDLLNIGYQSRPRLFELNIVKPAVLYDEVREIDARVTIEGFDEDVDGLFNTTEEIPDVLVRGTSGDMVRILKPIDDEQVRRVLRELRGKGFDTLAVCLTHSHIFPDHEVRVHQLAIEEGFSHISLSSAVAANMIKMVPRGSSASADAYVTPEIRRYLAGFMKGFEGGNLEGVRCEFMQSDGGLVSHNQFSGIKGLLSGPAGGVVGYAQTSYDEISKVPVVGFDMGGTSTDVSRYGGQLEHIFETTTAGVAIQSPQLDINTVAAGGGSILAWRKRLFAVGPESASSHPGPACYRKRGPLTVTDANLFLGRLLPDYFPKIFGKNESEALDLDTVQRMFADLTATIYSDTGNKMSPEEVAWGFLDVANEAMCRPIRALTEGKGYDIANHHLSVFGGAGGQHACDVARKLGISTVIIHKYSSILSAYGMALADFVQEAQEPVNEVYGDESRSRLLDRLSRLRDKVCRQLNGQGISNGDISYQRYLNMRYQGTETAIMVLEPADGDFKEEFKRMHLREFAFLSPDERPIIVDDVRVRGVGTCNALERSDGQRLGQKLKYASFSGAPQEMVERTTKVYFPGTGKLSVPVFLLPKLEPLTLITGPAIIIDQTQTLVITPGAEARVLSNHVVIQIKDTSSQIIRDPDSTHSIQLSLFAHRFMSIAEQMGRVLQKTAVSLNIKERLDFSCALFGPDGGLVANAPHVPVHLGSMSYAVKYQHELHKGKLVPGDVLVSNHPEAGGTHLPDITVITPVFETSERVAFYVASRGHHTDIGGLGGTSMPPDSTELWQEGAAIRSFKLIHAGDFDEFGITEILLRPGEYPGCTGSRHVSDNISDLKAQVAANHKGVMLVQDLIKEYTLPVVQRYMKGIQSNAEWAVRDFLRATIIMKGSQLVAEDRMDNGSRIKLTVMIGRDGSAVFDFTGTDCELLSNINAPPAITYSAIIYSLRVLIGSDIPLNQGCLTPINVVLPKGTFLNPSAGPAVCAGNTQTSQRIVDVILKAFRAAAASHGCMNCIGFFGEGGKDAEGKKLNGYAYAFGETIGGGSGATSSQPGASGVHTHMTNTRITDPESLEKRYPVILREFAIRPGTGGKGMNKGGDGVVRDIECRAPLSFSVITERRTVAPYGMNGGEPGQCGANYLVRKIKGVEGEEWRWVNMGAKNMVKMEAGDRAVIYTPGGGGWGHDFSGGLYGEEVITYPRASGSVAARMMAQESSA